MSFRALLATAPLSLVVVASYVTGCGGDGASSSGAPTPSVVDPLPAEEVKDAGADTGFVVDSGPVATDAGIDAADAADAADAGALECIATDLLTYPVGSCGEDGSPATCVPRPVQCSQLFKPVCGCNGATYANDCKAASVGQNLRSLLACP